MTLEEAQKVANVIRQADGGCSTCVRDLVSVMNEVFPEFNFEQTDEREEVGEYERYERIRVTRR